MGWGPQGSPRYALLGWVRSLPQRVFKAGPSRPDPSGAVATPSTSLSLMGWVWSPLDMGLGPINALLGQSSMVSNAIAIILLHPISAVYADCPAFHPICF